MRVYISGPMSGLPECNRPAFEALRLRLRAEGHFVICPAELDVLPKEQGAGAPASENLWRGFLIRDIAMLLTCQLDAIVMLPGWEKSRGSRLEMLAAMMVGLEVLDEALEPIGGEGVRYLYVGDIMAGNRIAQAERRSERRRSR